MNRVDKAVDLFMGGFNCSQAIFCAFGEQEGLDPRVAARIGTGLGAGMGRMQHTCGAVTGAFLALGLKHGAATGEDKDAKEQTYRLVREFAARFKARNGSIICRELLGCDISTPEGLEEFKRKGLHTAVCAGLVRGAAEILEDSTMIGEKANEHE